MHSALLVLLALLAYAVCIVVYRLCFSPLARFPGPKIAAATSWYNGYYDVIKGGQYVWVVEDMHRKYGPMCVNPNELRVAKVRTRPDTLHVNDPKFVETLYSQSPKNRRERHSTVLGTLYSPGSVLDTKDHDLHRRRRAVVSPYFSHANVRRLEPVINETLSDLLGRFENWAKQGEPVGLDTVFRAATKDVIQAYAFGDAEKCLDMDDCNAAFFDLMIGQGFVHLGTHARWLGQLFANLPPALMILLIPRVAVFARFMEGLNAQIDEIRNTKELPESKTIFHEIMQSDIPPSEKETQRLADEAMVFLFAGTDTTASTLGAIVYSLLADPALLARLRKELQEAMPDPSALPIAAELDKLPLLNAIVKEALRLYPGATHRQDRVAPDEDLVYERPDGSILVIPAGTGVGMTAPLLNRHPDIYDSPHEFRPDRYIENPSLYKHILTFSKGTRQCVGMQLAYQELQTFTAGIFRKYDAYDSTRPRGAVPTLQLYKTEKRDIEMHGDGITPIRYEGSKGLRVVIRH